MKHIFTLVAMLWSFSIFAQTTVTGKVTDAQGNPIPGANLKIQGKDIGTSTDFDGFYTLNVPENPPFTVEASNVGFQTQSATVTKKNQELNFVLEEAAEALDEVVVSASRTPERIKESPVTIERIDAKIIQNAPTADFYDGLENLKGVDINTNSLTFKSVNTRGFATFSNNRFVQLVDGIDNTSPALNFVLGNLIGMNELDVNTVEILPGASSALYGANAFNGILFMTSKSPFDDQGISTYFKTGLTMQDVAGDHKFYDTGIRAAYKFSEKFAGKANFSFMKGTDWMSADYNQYTFAGAGIENNVTPYANRGNVFDGLNIYGDEITSKAALSPLGLDMETLAYLYTGYLLPSGTIGEVSMSGYKESELTDYNARSIKADFALHFRPWENDKEFIFNYRTGRGNTIYQGGNRFYIKDFVMNQMKLEFKGKNFFVRGYRTSEDAGDSYDMRFAGINMSKQFAGEWFANYASVFTQAYLQSNSSEFSHTTARAYTDANVTPQPGTPEFTNLFDAVTADPNLLTGAKFVDNSKVNHVDANYNLAGLINDWADLQIGGSYRQFALNSDGTIFTDYDGAIKYNEYGAYAQLSKKFADDRLKFTGSLRYDKGQNFDGAYSPRIAFVYAVGENLNHNIRASFQTGFRNPTTQDQYIGLDLGQAILVGSAHDNIDRYVSKPIAVSVTGQYLGAPSTVVLSGRSAYENAFSYSSILTGTPEAVYTEYIKPEKISAYELGYRGKIGSINVDVNGYFNQYQDFIANKTVIVPLYGQVGDNSLSLLALANKDFQPFQVYTNSPATINSYGGSLGLSTKIDKFEVGANYTYSKYDFDQTTDPDYEAGFNSPENKIKLSFGSEELFKNFGFGINYRWQDEFLWQSNFVDATIPSRSVFDAQINYKVPSIKSEFKVGGSNIGGKNYLVAPGSGMIGSQYFVSWTINQ